MNSTSLKSRMRELFPDLAKKIEDWEQLSDAEKEAINQAQEAEEKRELKIQLIEQWKARGVTDRYMREYWHTWQIKTDGQVEALEKIRAWQGKKNLMLYGKSGTGKTHIGMSMAKDGAMYKRLPDIFREVRTNFQAEQEIINRYGGYSLLVIDEIGRQKFSDFEKNLFFEIIDKRWNCKKTVVLITNLELGEFGQEYGAAIMDRLRPVAIKFDWESMRE